jgi:hypothetical protein
MVNAHTFTSTVATRSGMNYAFMYERLDTPNELRPEAPLRRVTAARKRSIITIIALALSGGWRA